MAISKGLIPSACGHPGSGNSLPANLIISTESYCLITERYSQDKCVCVCVCVCVCGGGGGGGGGG